MDTYLQHVFVPVIMISQFSKRNEHGMTALYTCTSSSSSHSQLCTGTCTTHGRIPSQLYLRDTKMYLTFVQTPMCGIMVNYFCTDTIYDTVVSFLRTFTRTTRASHPCAYTCTTVWRALCFYRQVHDATFEHYQSDDTCTVRL